MRYLIFLSILIIGCKPCKEFTKTDTLYKTVLSIDTVKVTDENLLTELDRCYSRYDSAVNIRCPEPIINVSGGKVKIKNNKGLQLMIAYKSTIDSLKLINARINKEKTDCNEKNDQVIKSYKKSLLKAAASECKECSWWNHFLLIFYGFIAGVVFFIIYTILVKIKVWTFQKS